MSSISSEWKLGQRGHANFDFVDIELSSDTKLFIDPICVETGRHEISEPCMHTINSFFDEFFDAFKRNDNKKKYYLLSHAHEQNCTKLGYGYPGKGNTPLGLIQILSPLSNLMEKIPSLGMPSDLVVLIEDFAEDGLSDMLTNILHKELHEYTLRIMEKYGIKPNGTTDFFSWDVNTHRWQLFSDQPCYISEYGTVLLVPKVFVREKYLFSANQFIRRVMLERMRNESQSDVPRRQQTPKEEFLRTKVSQKEENWRHKRTEEYTTNHPDALEEYHLALPRFYAKSRSRIDDERLDKKVYKKSGSKKD